MLLLHLRGEKGVDGRHIERVGKFGRGGRGMKWNERETNCAQREEYDPMFHELD